ncbi:SpoIIE family protein phosphatase [Symbioplanes lichenis]|uniref:SpoIIE family protein phosphatase n=1 Tax=Symbioplanes lichenis TaxID=1629072 RepID=UPI002738F91A|nr:SpoIIE family protein phosphatase [Actinoplanes lichenis]
MTSAAPAGGGAVVDRAIGLLAGRTRCRLAEAHRHLLQMAADEGRPLADVARDVIALLDPPEATGAPALRLPVPPPPDAVRLRRSEPWLAVVQAVLDTLPGNAALLLPVRDPGGRLVDLEYAATTPGAVTSDGTLSREMVGRRLAAQFPEELESERWRMFDRVLSTGEPAETGPFTSREGRYMIRAHRLGSALLVTWERLDVAPAEDARIAATERLGNLGWGEWDLVSGDIRWSAQLYRIYGRDPALGPMPHALSEAMIVPEDRPLHAAVTEAFARGEQVDMTVRIRVGDQIKHVHAVIDATRDTTGKPLRVFGIVQDVTARETAALRLAEVERQLAEQRRSAAAEHEVATRLRQVILPIPDEPVPLPGLKVAVRYLPAARDDLVGGDWYHAAAQRDGSVLLAVGDVAGHGTPAATMMAQLRYSLRALAVTTSDPAELLTRLNRLVADLAAESELPETTATAVVARYEPARRRLVWAQAGHPPPLLHRAGRTAPLPRPSGPILGVLDDARYEAAVLDLRLGDVLLCYTDGLVEHRHRGPDDGLADVRRTMDEAVAARPRRPLEELLGRLRRANPADDTCLLALRPITDETRDLRGFLRF